jgi:hypothetical protein
MIGLEVFTARAETVQLLKQCLLVPMLCGLLACSFSSRAGARQAGRHVEVTTTDADADLVGDVDGTHAAPRKAAADTIWIADWTFDAGGRCSDLGWEKIDNYVRYDGRIYWTIGPEFEGAGSIEGGAAILGYAGEICCAEPDGYANDWHQAIRLQYTGSATLSFDYLLDSEACYDFLNVETDSACASFDLVDYAAAPPRTASSYRRIRAVGDGLELNGRVAALPLADHGPGTHCVYIAFFSDGAVSPCDGLQPSNLGKALVVDHIRLADARGTYVQEFEGTVPPGLFVNLQDREPFGQWGRVHPYVTDNDACTENRTCAWLWTDHTTPTVAGDPSMAFGPGGYVVKGWLDNSIVSPWVSLAATRSAVGTFIRFRRFPGNFFGASRLVANWSVRGRRFVQRQPCVSEWGHAFQWNSLDRFGWITLTFDMTPYFDPSAAQIQVRHRVTDSRLFTGNGPPPGPLRGPGPYMDDTRIGRVVLAGPVLSEGLDARSQAQDCFPTQIHTGITPGTGEHFRPTTSRFGSCAFSSAADRGLFETPNLITGDSVWVAVGDVRGAGGIVSVAWYGAIVSGPHAGKAPAPYSVGANGFFLVIPDSVRTPAGVVVAGFFSVDLDDTYFRGGDVLHYFWLAEDMQGGAASDPDGLSGVPPSIEAAQEATRGLLEVSFLPAVDWTPEYLARLAADPHGDLEPTPAEIAASSQRGCILYVNQLHARRRSGDVNRTSFMFTLDALGYRDRYDVYDHSGMGDTNNHLGGRATVQQARGYSLIVYDAGTSGPGRPIMPDGDELGSEKVDQAGWFHDWLFQAPLSESGFATLWVIGSDALEEKRTNSLYTADMGVGLVRTSQAPNGNPDVEGQTSFTFDKGAASSLQDFTSGSRGLYSLSGRCPSFRSYDGLAPAGPAVAVYRYKEHGGAPGDGAIVMRSHAAENWNTILQSHPWFDIRDPFGGSTDSFQPERDLLATILQGVLPPACLRQPTVTDTPGADAGAALPRRTALYQNVPNPFNPLTTIRFDLARPGSVRLRIYDVAGRRVRTLVEAWVGAGAGKSAVWDGLDGAGLRVPSGLYFYRLEAGGAVVTRKMLLVE